MKEKKLFQKIIERRKRNFAEINYHSDIERQFFQENEGFQKDVSKFFICLDDVKKFKKELHFEKCVLSQSFVHEQHEDFS